MSWAQWDLEHRSAGVRETKMSGVSTKVTSGGKHLGNIHKEANGTHTAVTKVGGVLQSHNFQSHQGALNHIRKTHGLPGVSAKKAAAPHMPGMGLASLKKTAAKKVAAPAAKKVAAPPPAVKKAVAAPAAKKAVSTPPATHAFASWDAEHGSGGGGVSSADKIAASIRGALGPGKMDAPKVESKTSKTTGSTISRAESARSAVAHVQKKDLKRPAPVKGEKDAADAFRTKIRMAEYNRKKEAAKAADPVNAMTPKTEVGLNPHDKPKAELAKAATEKAFAHPTVENHKAAEKAVLAAAKEAAANGNASGASHWTKLAMLHGKHADELSKSSSVSSSADKIAAMIKSTHAEQRGKPAVPDLPPVSKLADAASKKAHENPTSMSAHQAAVVAHTKAQARASLNGDGALVKYHQKAINEHMTAANKLADEMDAKIQAQQSAKHTVPELKQQTHAAGSAEDLANKADEATRLANESPSYVNHQKAYEAHGKALAKIGTGYNASSEVFKARDYHTMMQGYHRFAADHPDKVIPAGISEEHTDKLADRLPEAAGHQRHASFTDTASRRHSQQMYDAVPKASAANLTAGHKAAIKAYTGSGYTTINNYHRHVLNGTQTMGPTDQEYAKKHTANLDAAFAKQPALEHDLITYRGTRNANKMFGAVGEKVGGEFVDHGYTSTSSHAAVGGGFGGGTAGATAETSTLIRVLHPAGSKVLKPSEVGGFGDSEREILTPRGTRYHIAADRVVTLQNGRTQRQVDLVRK